MWSWKLKPSKECVTTHLPNAPAPKMDDAEADHLWYAGFLVKINNPGPRRRAWGTSRSVWRKPAWIVRLVQILVVVAIILSENTED